MRVLMFTNTYAPHVSGVARSVSTLEEDLRERGHKVHVVAPEFEEACESSYSVTRLPAIQRFNGTDFAMRIPFPGATLAVVDAFRPDVIHSHHPFLLGDAAARASLSRNLPLVFTYHTRYEEYTRYVPVGWPVLRRLAVELATSYCNLCDRVIAPSGSIREILDQREVGAPVRVVPTGVDLEFFRAGRGDRFRAAPGIPAEAVVLGHVGRLAGEKNLIYLANGVAAVLEAGGDSRSGPWFVAAGRGDAEEAVFDRLSGFQDRVVRCGTLRGSDLADCYAAMDLFLFASHSETQGMVLAEAMVSGTPVIALDAPGARDIVVDGLNGCLLPAEAGVDAYAQAVLDLVRDPTRRRRLVEGCLATVRAYSREETVLRVEEVYREAIAERGGRLRELDPWDRAAMRLGAEWKLASEKLAATAAAVRHPDDDDPA